MKTVWIFFFCMLLLGGCSDRVVNPNPATPQKEIYPLATGDVRIYVDTLFYSDKSVAQVTFDTEWVGMSVSIHDTIWYVLSNNQYPRGNFYANRNDGLHYHNVSGTSVLSYKFPANRGEIYNDQIDSFVGSRHYTKVESIDTMIHANDSIYSCYCYQSFFNSNIDPWYIQYVCPGVGTARIEDSFDETWTKDGNPVKNGTESVTILEYRLK